MLTNSRLTHQQAGAVRAFSGSVGWCLSRAPGARFAIAMNLLPRLGASELERLGTFAALCRERTTLNLLDSAGLRAWAVGPQETVLILGKDQKPKPNENIAILFHGSVHQLTIASAKYFDAASGEVKELIESSLTPAPPPPAPLAPAMPAASPVAAAPVAGKEFDLCGLVAGTGLQSSLAFARKISAVTAPVTITGETGTGKEMFARIIHANSPRSGELLVAINCSAIPEGLIESELFGHEKGAFTGALSRKTGIFERASRGTVFLDEVADMSPATQVKLLRVLSNGSFFRVGGSQEMKTEARIIAATNKDFAAEIRAGRFRQDLFYRLSVLDLKLPPLRERRGDIPELARRFLSLAAQKTGRRLAGFSAEAELALRAADWPGNVRELENCVTRAVVLAEGETVSAGDLKLPVFETEPFAEALSTFACKALKTGLSYREIVRSARKTVLAAALEKTGGDKTAAAKLLGISYSGFRHMHFLAGLK